MASGTKKKGGKMPYQEVKLTIRCRGRNSKGEKVLGIPTWVTVKISTPMGADEDLISSSVICPHNSGGHGDKCAAAGTPTAKIDPRGYCPYAFDLPYAADARFKAQN